MTWPGPLGSPPHGLGAQGPAQSLQGEADPDRAQCRAWQGHVLPSWFRVPALPVSEGGGSARASPIQGGGGVSAELGLPASVPRPHSPRHPTMDAALALQMGETVAEKVLRYRRDQSGWRPCRPGVSGVGREGSPGPSSAASLAAAPWRWVAETSRGGRFLKNYRVLVLTVGR